MKLTAIALSLCCSALVCKAGQSNVFHLQLPKLAQFPQILFPLESMPVFPLTVPPPVLSPTAPAIPLLSKEETLTLIAGAAARHRVPAGFVASIVAAESNFNCAAISPKGAIGLMQLMPETALQFGANPAVPAENIDAGTQYLRWLMDRYQKKRGSIRYVIAAYNAGPGNVDRYHGVPPFRETRNYVTRVLRNLKLYSPSGKQAGGGVLMASEMLFLKAR